MSALIRVTLDHTDSDPMGLIGIRPKPENYVVRLDDGLEITVIDENMRVSHV